MRILEHIVQQHAEEAAFLWILRDSAVSRPDYQLYELINLENRLEAHLDGLRVNGDPAWDIVKKQLEDVGAAGEVFAAGVLALESGQQERIDPVIEAGKVELEVARGLVSAFDWVSLDRAKSQLTPLFAAENPLLRRVAVAAAAAHRWDPGQPLRKVLRDKDVLVKARALRAAGELGLVDELHVVKKNLETDDTACRFWAAWSATLLARDTQALQALRLISLADGPYQTRAARMTMHADDMTLSRKLLTRLQEKPEWARMACFAAGDLGDPVAVPWLLEQMTVPELARGAAEAFCTLTGIDLVGQNMEADKPEGFESGPTEDPADENVAMDEDDSLPWPKLELLRPWWEAQTRNYTPGRRYFLGKPCEESNLLSGLRTAWQRQRATAALELAVRNPKKTLFEVRAPGLRQQQILSAIK